MNKQITGSVAIFVHWSSRDKVSQSDERLIEALADTFDNVLVVKNLNKSNRDTESILRSHDNVYHLHRQNIGYDFGGYVAGMKQLANQRDSISEILIINNSVYLATTNLCETISRVRSMDSNVTAMTNSNEIDDHLQSYFIHFDRSCLTNAKFWEYWQEVETYDDKSLTIQNLELRLSSSMNDIGLSTNSVYEYRYLIDFALSPIGLAQAVAHRNDSGFIHALSSARNGVPLNPTHYFWFWLRELGYPFLKKDLLRDFGDLGLGLEKWKDGIPQNHAKSIRSELKNRNLRK